MKSVGTTRGDRIINTEIPKDLGQEPITNIIK